MSRVDPVIADHLDWLGLVQPTGLVVSAAALAQAGAVLDRNDRLGQDALRACTGADFEQLARQVLGWNFSPKGYAGRGTDDPIPAELELALPDYELTLRPDIAVRERDPAAGAPPWQLLVRVVNMDADFDRQPAGDRFEATEHGRMERLLRHTGVSAGLLFNGKALRLISAPRGESSGWLDFDIDAMVQTAGRSICAAMRMLLSQTRLLALAREQRLAALLGHSREFQNEVSEKLAVQVLHGLYELLRGFQAADDASGHSLLSRPLAEQPDDVYRALLTVILRLVFLLYAEERGMLPGDETFTRYYSVAGLYARLREDEARYADTMGQRYGAWAQLLALFRIVYDGATVGGLAMPPRHGALFDPDRYPFLEGRTTPTARQSHERIEPPLVPDGTVFRVLEKLLVLDGERLSYRALDVEQIGSVYETMMGFRLQRATGRSVAIKAGKPFGAPTTVDLDELLGVPAAKRGKWLQDNTDRNFGAKVTAGVRDADSLEDLHAALGPVIEAAATPDLVPPEAMVLQPSPERRRSGSHYTPRALTRPIVETTLAPILAELRGEDGSSPTPEQILELKVCDPAMGSAAFLVEACRQLADQLVLAWAAHGGRPDLPADEDELTLARRLVAQRCLYGVDRNPVAVDLAKMSLWLVTLAREHPLTFLDHALRHGDSLVGLTRRQIETFHWDSNAPSLAAIRIGSHLTRVSELRAQIREAPDDTPDAMLRDLWDETQHELAQVRLYGDLVVYAFFEGHKAKTREAKRIELADAVINCTADSYASWLEELRHDVLPLAPFHWQVEFPEVFERAIPGFDAIVGNPPFAGKNTQAEANIARYADWLKQTHPESHGNADLVAHFFRRAFELLRDGGTLGLIATNTIGQGDTRSTGLRYICTHGGEVYSARKRVKWPGRSAAVVVSVVHIVKGTFDGQRMLDGRPVSVITAYLFHAGGNEDPTRLGANAGKSFQGSIVLGMGFTFDDTDMKGVANSLAEMERLKAANPANAEVIFPYIGYAEVADSPTHSHHRYVINFFDRGEDECRRRWPELMAIIEDKVKPERDVQKRDALRLRWWQYAEKRPGLVAAITGLDRVLVAGSQAATHYAIAFLPAGTVYSSNLTVFAVDTYAGFGALQSRPQEVWARFFMSTMKDDLAYTPTSCFEPFPFPAAWQSAPALEVAGQAYHDFRADLMIRNDEGLTHTYNRFHDPYESDPDILTLRDLHADMDSAVLSAYGWDDIPTDCAFIADYEGAKHRYRWPDHVRDEVLARLIALNAERAAAEQRSGAAAAAGSGSLDGGRSDLKSPAPAASLF